MGQRILPSRPSIDDLPPGTSNFIVSVCGRANARGVQITA
jgi:hypothetical protein